MMKNIIFTGANGMIGNLILQMCLKSEQVNHVTSISRRSLGFTHPKLTEVIHQDFLNFGSIQNHFENQDICFYCLGVYTGAVSTEEFKRITVDYTKAFAETLKQTSPNCSFSFLSGDGADQKEKSPLLFGKQKGIAENVLIKLNFKRLNIFQPRYIYPVNPRVEPNMMYRFMRVIHPLAKIIYPNMGCTSVQLANKMFDAAFNKSDQLIFSNRDIRN